MQRRHGKSDNFWRLPPGASAGLPDEITRELSVQDEGSQLVAARVAAESGQRVLDVCAAPGGKSAWLARAVGRQGLVVSCDTRPARLMVLTLHPFLIGQPFRIGVLDAALAHIAGQGGVWMATGSEIIDWYRR